jgi:hypothetical protein
MSNSAPFKPLGFMVAAALFGVGFFLIAALYAIGGWWLDSGTGVLRAGLGLMVLGVLAGFSPSGKRWGRACSLWAGAISASTAILFWSGPGTIWPIVLAFSAGITGGAVFVGAVVGSALNSRRHPPDRARKAR